MGGRGASIGIYKWRGHVWYYGEEYQGALTNEQYNALPEEDRQFLSDNKIKFVKPRNASAQPPLETMTSGRIYVTINYRNDIKFVSFYDTNSDKVRQIDFDYSSGKLKNIHAHNGYDTPHSGEHDTITATEGRLVKHILDIWTKSR